MSWWHGADHAGHEYGPDVSRTRDALRAQDRVLGTLLAGLDARKAWATTTLLIASDHGMTAYARDGRRAGEVLAEAGIRARVIHGLATAQIHLKEPDEAGRAVAVLRSSRPRGLAARGDAGRAALPAIRAPATWSRSRSLRSRCCPRSERRALRRPRAALRPSARRAWLRPGALRRMHGIFVALGRGVPKGVRLPRVRAIDVAPTVAELLGIEAPGAERRHGDRSGSAPRASNRTNGDARTSSQRTFSSCSQKVRLVLAEKRLDLRLASDRLISRRAAPPDYVKLNPNHVVPTLVHDGPRADRVVADQRVSRRGFFPEPGAVGPRCCRAPHAHAALGQADRREGAPGGRRDHLRDRRAPGGALRNRRRCARRTSPRFPTRCAARRAAAWSSTASRRRSSRARSERFVELIDAMEA